MNLAVYRNTNEGVGMLFHTHREKRSPGTAREVLPQHTALQFPGIHTQQSPSGSPSTFTPALLLFRHSRSSHPLQWLKTKQHTQEPQH